MITYNFRNEFAPQIATGAASPKTVTLRRERKHPARHAHAGEPIGLWTGLRTKDAKRHGVGIVTLRGALTFSAAGLVSYIGAVTHDALDPVTNALLAEINTGEADAFARRDGFTNWAACWRFHSQRARTKEVSLELIAWRPLNAAQIAALESGELLLTEVA